MHTTQLMIRSYKGLLLFALLPQALTSSAPSAVIACPVANLLAQPKILYTKMAPVSAADTPHLSSQLIYGEPISIIKREGDWVLVASPTTRIMHKQQLQPLRGWIAAAQTAPLRSPYQEGPHEGATELVCTAPLTPVFKKIAHNPHQFMPLLTLPYEARLQALAHETAWWRVKLVDGTTAYVPAPSVVRSQDIPTTPAQIRTQIITHARQFLGTPYCWGGASSYNPSYTDQLTGFDCSSLVFRLYKACNIVIPRNSRSQFALARPKEPAKLEAGDLLFLAYPAHSQRIVHVLIYTGTDSFIEAWMERLPGNILNVQPLHEVTTRDRFGKSIHEMAQGDRCGYYTCFGGTFLP